MATAQLSHSLRTPTLPPTLKMNIPKADTIHTSVLKEKTEGTRGSHCSPLSLAKQTGEMLASTVTTALSTCT